MGYVCFHEALFFRLKSGLFLHLFLTVPVEQEHDFSVEKDEAQAHEQSPSDEEVPLHVTHDKGWQCPRKENIPAEQYDTSEETIPTEEPCVAASEGALPADESCMIASDRGSVSEKDHSKRKNAYPDTMWKPSQVELITKRFDELEQHLWTNKKSHEPK